MPLLVVVFSGYVEQLICRTDTGPMTKRKRAYDGRTVEARRHRDLVRRFKKTHTAAGGDPGVGDDFLVETLATMVMEQEALKAKLIRGEDVDPDHIIRIGGTVRRFLAESVRQSVKRNNGRAGGPDLASYIASKQAT
jgi:hypothetical protein